MGIIKKQNSNRQIQMLKTLCIAATLFLSAEAVTIHLRQEDASTAAPTGEAPAMDDEMFAPIGDLEGHVPSLPVLPEGAAQVADLLPDVDFDADLFAEGAEPAVLA